MNTGLELWIFFMKHVQTKEMTYNKLYLLKGFVRIQRLQIPQELPELFLILAGHEDLLHGHGAAHLPAALSCYWTWPDSCQ